MTLSDYHRAIFLTLDKDGTSSILSIQNGAIAATCVVDNHEQRAREENRQAGITGFSLSGDHEFATYREAVDDEIRRHMDTPAFSSIRKYFSPMEPNETQLPQDEANNLRNQISDKAARAAQLMMALEQAAHTADPKELNGIVRARVVAVPALLKEILQHSEKLEGKR